MSRLGRFIRKRSPIVIREYEAARREAPFWFGARFGGRSGVARSQKKISLIVTLTTIPERLEKLPVAVESLLRQRLRPDRLILWLGNGLKNRRLPFPLRQQMKRGLEIRFVPDIGPYTKIIYALQEFSGCLIVSCDDDTIYPADWLEELVEAHRREPHCVVCRRPRQMEMEEDGELRPFFHWKFYAGKTSTPSLTLFPECVSGILYPPGSLHPEVFNESVFRKICPLADDIWMKAMALMNNVRCHASAPARADLPIVRGTQHKSLWSVNSRGGNDAQLRAVFERYDLYRHLSPWDFPLLREPSLV